MAESNNKAAWIAVIVAASITAVIAPTITGFFNLINTYLQRSSTPAPITLPTPAATASPLTQLPSATPTSPTTTTMTLPSASNMNSSNMNGLNMRVSNMNSSNMQRDMYTDAGIQKKLDRALANDLVVADATFDAIVDGRRVRLTGTVNSSAIKQRAESIARSIEGVVSVNNELIVRP